MPRIRRREKVRRADLIDLNFDQRRHLEHGNTFFVESMMDRETFESAWDIHGEAILAEWIVTGFRPFGWWLLEHGKERPFHPSLSATQQQECRRRERESWRGHFGFAHSSNWGAPCVGWWQEPEPHYLNRLGLLEPGEWDAVVAQYADRADRLMSEITWP